MVVWLGAGGYCSVDNPQQSEKLIVFLRPDEQARNHTGFRP